MAKNSLFAILLRSPWWISAAIGVVMAVLAAALLPEQFRFVGAMSALPLLVIAAIAARRQWKAPSAARVSRTLEAVGAMPWAAFAGLLEQGFERDGFTVQRRNGGAADFELERAGRRTLVSARRWKSARIGVEPLRALQAERERAQAQDAMHIGLGELSEGARAFATDQGIAVWQGADLARALQGLTLPTPPAR